MITVIWDNPDKTAIRQDFSGELLYHEMDQAQQDIVDLLDSVSHPVTLFMVLGADLRFTGDVVSRFPKMARAPMMTHENLAEIIMVGARGLAATMVDIFLRVYPPQMIRMSQATSLEDARNKIAARGK